ncbi:MAG: RNA polymerase factor sigma-54 [Halobacteriovoraceae bacterium]|nr:RNA polymerase factor sigma-54 [Halobacteriovoraceae bacterium]
MAMKMNQSLKQTQNLTMTPQLQQAIKLLTLTHLEMTNVIAKEMVENPMLEELDSEKTHEELASDRSVREIESTAENFSGPELVDGGKEDFDWQKYIESYNNSSSTSPNSSREIRSKEDQPDYENMVSQEMSLQDHLEWQMRMEDIEGVDLQLGLMIIHNLDDDGFLETSLDEIIRENGIEIDLSRAEEILELIQYLDPVGCGTKNTKEALIIQARAVPGRVPLVEEIINNHLEDVYKKDYDKIVKATGSNIENVKTAEMIIMTFHPRPGRLISSEQIHYVVPDIYVKEISGELVIQLNDEGVPRLKISKLYQSLLKNSGDGQTKNYIQDKLRSAMWLLKSIENRQKTIEKVAKAIVAYQPEFFKKGPEHLKPMILKDIAEEIGMHESTISRVTTNKFMHTPLGTFELKYFFNSGVGGKDGGVDIASESLKLKIKSLIEKEDPKKPLSDQKIATILSESGIVVARRTIAKYRESLGILSSAKRKRK